jgi:hypothetical protein
MMIKTPRFRNPVGILGLFLATALIMTGCAASGMLTRPVAPGNIMHFSEVKNWDKTKSLNNQVLYVNQGESFPLSLSIDSDFMAVKQDHIDIVAKEKIYFMIKMPSDISETELKRLNTLDAQSVSEMDDRQMKTLLKNYMLYLSRDAVHWAPMNDGQAIKEAMGFKSGRVSFGMMASTINGLGASLNLKTIK